MLRLFLISISVLIFNSCSNGGSKDLNKNRVNNKKDSNLFFDYDAVVHYASDFSENDILKIMKKAKESKMDSVKVGVAFHNIPKELNDTIFVEYLTKVGYNENKISNSKFSKLNEVFRKNKSKRKFWLACAPVYRDILIFKKKNKTIGIVKICFGCMQHEIFGAKANTDNFGTDSDFQKLHTILKIK